MKVTSRLVRFIAAGLLLALSACGGDDDGSGGTPPPPPPAQTGIGAAGGTVTGPNGSKVVIPAGALTTNIDIKIEQTSAGSPPLPGGFSAAGQMFAFTPHGTTFAVPVTVTLPFDSASVPAGSAPVLFKTINAQDQWEQVANAVFSADTVSAEVTSFSFLQPVIPPVVRGEPERIWNFFVGGELLRGDTQVGGVLDEFEKFGPNLFDMDGDGEMTMEVFSSADGVTFWVSTEDQGLSSLIQTQAFTKTVAGATLQFVITAATLEAFDVNLPSPSECPRGLDLAVCTPLYAQISYKARALDTLGRPMLNVAGVPLFDVRGFAHLKGRLDAWNFSTDNRYPGSTRIWSRADFTFTQFAEGSTLPVHPKLELVRPIVLDIDLSSVGVGEVFFVETFLDVFAEGRGRESGIGAYLRDPARVGGAQMNFTGLEPTNAVLPPSTPTGVSPPVPCSGGADPAAGVLQFSAPTYTMLEAPFVGLNGIEITRTQGSTGAVSATLTVAGGDAVPGVHYTPLAISVRFEDGDTTPRTVPLEVIDNGEDQPDRTVNLTLSEPGGCVSLGSLSTAALTILDDERPPPPPPPSGLDPSFGIEGKSSSEAFGGDRSAMALQPDGKVVIVGGTPADFILARFNADGSLDSSFDADGKVTTDMVSNEQEEALGVAIQPDGKIVVVGYTGTPGPGGPSSFALARYNTDGSLDASFGSGGKIVSGVLGNAYAIAIQSDGKIVVAGDVPISNGADFANFALARYDANGSLDASFGPGGQFTTDIGGGTNTARNIVLQANGAIVVSGEPFGTFNGSDHTDIVRYDTNGNPDTNFGVGGKLTLNGARVGEGLALQGDGKFVLVGNVDVSVPPALPGTVTEFAVRRLNAAGGPDNSFGSAGAASTTISGQRDSAQAVALQSDGKILVAGRSSNINVDFAVARFNSNGTLDTGFGGNAGGKLTIDFFGFTDIAESVAVQPDGKIVLGGLARNNVDGYGVARINP
jgi:uncharacterized delta-60 repeat protein